MNERRELPVVGTVGGTNRITTRAEEVAARPASGTAPPGPSLRDPAYHDLCEFFGSYADAQAWEPAPGDWVYLSQSREVCLVVAVEPSGGTAEQARLQVTAVAGGEGRWLARAESVWLPTLSQLRVLLHDVYGSVGFFTSVFTDTTYWYTGDLVGMQVEKMTPLAEGRSPEEAAVKALLMRFQR